jgi:hypothetical protein
MTPGETNNHSVIQTGNVLWITLFYKNVGVA